MKNNELAFNRTNFSNLKKERDMLKITLRYITEENKNLKNELDDMRITANKNKDMLKEYVYQITNKDKLFEKMTSTIEQLKSRLKAMEQSKKNKQKIERDLKNDIINYNTNTNNHSTTTNSNNLTTNNIIATSGENNFSFGFNILNNKYKKNNLIEINNKSNKSTSNILIEKNFNILNNKYNEISSKKEININDKNKNNIIKETEKKNYDMKYFFEKQKRIMEEIDNIKDDLEFLMENKSKTKMKEKLNQSLVFNNSLNSSFCSEQRNPGNYNDISFTSEKSLDNSYLSNLSVTYNGPDPNMLKQLNYNLNTSQHNNIENFKLLNGNRKNSGTKKINYNLKSKYLIEENFSKFINKINMKKEILFLIDGKNNIWELLPRGDLTVEQIQKYENEKEKDNRIKSIINLCQDKNNNLINLLAINKEKQILEKGENENLIDIKIKDPTDYLFK